MKAHTALKDYRQPFTLPPITGLRPERRRLLIALTSLLIVAALCWLCIAQLGEFGLVTGCIVGAFSVMGALAWFDSFFESLLDAWYDAIHEAVEQQRRQLGPVRLRVLSSEPQVDLSRIFRVIIEDRLTMIYTDVAIRLEELEFDLRQTAKMIELRGFWHLPDDLWYMGLGTSAVTRYYRSRWPGARRQAIDLVPGGFEFHRPSLDAPVFPTLASNKKSDLLGA